MHFDRGHAVRLLQDAGDGSVQAFEALYETYADFVLNIAWKMTGSRPDAEDLCHEVFLEVWRQAASYDAARGSVEAWLAVKTRARCLDFLRRIQRRELQRQQLSARLEPSGAGTEEAALASIGFAQLRAALERIPPAQRQAVYGAYVEELSHSELARRMNRPLGTVKSFVRYGLKHLRRQLAESGWISGPEKEGRHESAR